MMARVYQCVLLHSHFVRTLWGMYYVSFNGGGSGGGGGRDGRGRSERSWIPPAFGREYAKAGVHLRRNLLSL